MFYYHFPDKGIQFTTEYPNSDEVVNQVMSIESIKPLLKLIETSNFKQLSGTEFYNTIGKYLTYIDKLFMAFLPTFQKTMQAGVEHGAMGQHGLSE